LGQTLKTLEDMMSQHELTLTRLPTMDFHQGWGICADQLETLAKTI
jgi:hypothetical protein